MTGMLSGGNSPAYDYRNCQSLFGYAAAVHERSGGICELCGFGRPAVDFDAWRQLTVEHLIGESQGGYRRAIRAAVAARYPNLATNDTEALAAVCDVANTVTACQFCNATTSRSRSPVTMTELIGAAPDDPTGLVESLSPALQQVLQRKRREVAWKLSSVRNAFENMVQPGLVARRAAISAEASDA
jgi:hypothetical protein